MPRKSRKNVGLIGLGIIGTRVAAGLRAGGYQVFVWNRTVKPAPNFLGSPAEVAEVCDIIQLFVGDAQALFDVIDQLSDALTPQHIIICNATVGPEATLEAARMVEERGARFLDAPFTGSRSAAEKRDLVYYIGGDDGTFLRARPVLEATSRAIVRIGPIGHAATIKVVTNMIAAVSVQVLGEALAIVQKAGLDPDVFAAALEHNACRSGTMDLKLPKMVGGNYEPHFSLKHMFKDVQLGIHVANGLEIEIPATTVTAGVMYGALNQGWSDLDFSAVYKVYESEAAPALRVPMEETPVLEDLDSREEHYKETHAPAPPRPALHGADSGAAEGGHGADEHAPEESHEHHAGSGEAQAFGAPRLADVLHAPEDVAAEARAHPEHHRERSPEDPLLADLDAPEAHVELEAAGPKPGVPSLALGTTPPLSDSPEKGHDNAPSEAGATTSGPAESSPSSSTASSIESLSETSSAERSAEDRPAQEEEHAPHARNGGSGEESPGGGGPKRANFVKRWFVARRGG